MKTACFFTYFGPGRVSIARFAPRQIPLGLRVYRPLAPGTWFNSVPYERYRELYFAQLANLHAQRVWDDLHALVAPHEPVLLCYERAPLTAVNWCHRTMVAEWFERTLGKTLVEIGEHRHD
jgi:hypothetical protein